ncbi:hypothetical protein [Arthrobacter sp. YAF16]|uniref:hypothetical protein n=1 Tax=Arthrobacter sp. YAF16 TaxID=3233076 RepID=UPI003F939105
MPAAPVVIPAAPVGPAPEPVAPVVPAEAPTEAVEESTPTVTPSASASTAPASAAPSKTSAPEPAQANQVTQSSPVIQAAVAAATGSPFGVQLVTVLVLLAAGFAYFRALGARGRVTSKGGR